MVAGAAAKARFSVIEGVAILADACEGIRERCHLSRLRRSLFVGGGGGRRWRGKGGGGERGRMTSGVAAIDTCTWR